MSFELLPHLTPWLVGFAVIALAGVVAAVAATTTLVTALAEDRRTRLARHESVRRYYGRVVLGH